MATIRRKKPEPFALLQRDPGPWSPILLYWLATLGIIIVFGLVMLFSASYTTGYLRFGDSLHFIRSQVLCLGLGVVAMALFSYLSSARGTYGMHSFPASRGCQFRTHLLSCVGCVAVSNVLICLLSAQSGGAPGGPAFPGWCSPW